MFHRFSHPTTKGCNTGKMCAKAYVEKNNNP